MSGLLLFSAFVFCQVGGVNALPFIHPSPRSTDVVLDQLQNYSFPVHKKHHSLAGHPDNFDCPYYSTHKLLSVRWFRNEKEIERAQRQRKIAVTKDGHLRFLSVEREDRGTYRCEVYFKDTLQTQTRKVKLIVHEKPTIVRRSAKKKHTTVGNPVFFYCEGAGKPQPRTVWLKNGKKLDTAIGTRYQLLSNMLGILDVIMEDAGDYTCIIRNKYGDAEATTTLTVQDPPPARPHIIYITPRINTTEGSNVTLRCTARNNYSNASIQWEVNTTDAPYTSYDIHIEKTTKGNVSILTSRLILQNVRSTTRTLVICRARNQIGSTTAAVRLSVKAI